MILSICESPNVLEVMRIVNIIIKIIKIAVPIILILFMMLEFMKAVSSNDSEALQKAKKNAISKMIAAALIFLIPTFVKLVVNVAAPDTDYAKCIIEVSKSTIEEAYEAIEEGLVKKAEETLKNADYSAAIIYLINIKDPVKRKEFEDRLAIVKEKIDNSSKKEDDNGIFHGTKYNLTEEEIVFLANVGYCEQGKTDGVKAEVSLAANLFELQSKHKTLIDYVKNSGWFACAKTEKKANQEQIEATRDVIVNGNRTLPLYINEHDCFNCSKKLCSNGNRGDICKLVIDGVTYESMDDIKNRSNYIKDKTIVYNKYGSVYTFYSFPCSGCDPFGYTASAYNARQDEDTPQGNDSGILKIYYLGIGRYDGILITGNDTTLFIDGGYVSHGKKEIEFIKSLGITKIDGLIGSHLHNNHIDAHKEFIKELDIKRVYYGENPGECLSNKTCVKSDTTPDELMNLLIVRIFQ